MKQYVMGIVGAAVATGFLEHLVPVGSKARGYVRLLAAVCILCLLIRPVGDALDALPHLISDISDMADVGETARSRYEDILEGEIRESVQTQLREAIARDLAREFGVTHAEVGVMLGREDGELRVQKVAVTLMGVDIFKNPHEIEDFFTNRLAAPCIVVVG